MAFARVNLGWVLLHSGQFQEAGPLIQAGIDAYTRLKDQQLLAFSYLIRADWLFETGERAAAEQLLLAQCLPEFSQIGDLWGVAVSRQRLGRIASLKASEAEARTYLQDAVDLFQGAGDRYGCSSTTLWLAKLARQSGAGQRAEVLLRAGLELALPMGVNDLIRAAYYELGQLYLAKEKRATAAIYFAAATYYGARCGAYRLDRLLTDLAPHRSWITAQLGSPSEPLEDYVSPLSLAELTDHWRTLPTPDAVLSNPGVAPGREVPESSFLQKVREVAEQELHDPDFSVQDLSQAMHLSHSQLHRKLKHLRGQSITQFVRDLRMEKATTLLTETDQPVTTIAYEDRLRDPGSSGPPDRNDKPRLFLLLRIRLLDTACIPLYAYCNYWTRLAQPLRSSVPGGDIGIRNHSPISILKYGYADRNQNPGRTPHRHPRNGPAPVQSFLHRPAGL